MAGFGLELGVVGFYKVGYYVDPSLMIEFYNGVSSSPIINNSTFYSVSAKKFFGNSFYGTIGPAYRRILLDDKFITSIFGLENHVYRYDDVGTDMAIGNQWQSDNFTIGCDWVGYYVPMKVVKNEFGDVKVPGNFKLLRFNIGVSF